MPTYSYLCTECGNRFDVAQAFTDDALTTCDRCSGRLRKLFSPVGVVFKGSGFYHNDSRAARKAATNGSNGSAKSDTTASADKSDTSGTAAKSSDGTSGTETKSSGSSKTSASKSTTSSGTG